MEYKFNKKQVKEILEKYYEETYDFKGNVTVSCVVGLVGYGLSEREEAQLTFKINGNISVGGMMVSSSQVISLEEVNNAFRSLFKKEEKEVSDISFDYGVRSHVEGYGLGEHTVNNPYFNGAVVSANGKVKAKGVING